MSNINHQVDPMDHGIITPNRSERRLSLPARVNVLVVDGQNYAQVSNLLRKNFKQSEQNFFTYSSTSISLSRSFFSLYIFEFSNFEAKRCYS